MVEWGSSKPLTWVRFPVSALSRWDVMKSRQIPTLISTNWIDFWKLKNFFAQVVSRRRVETLSAYQGSIQQQIHYWYLWNLSDARLPKWLRGSLEVRVVKTAWVQIPHLAASMRPSEDVRVVKERDSSSRGASRMGSNPISCKFFYAEFGSSLKRSWCTGKGKYWRF